MPPVSLSLPTACGKLQTIPLPANNTDTMSALGQWQDTWLALLAMNFNDMLKKKKKEDSDNSEVLNEIIAILI